VTFVAALPETPPDGHEWLSFEDPDEYRTWLVDVTFLSSRWRCLYGNGCQGVLTAPTPERMEGCCSYGVHMTDADDARRVEAAARTLSASQWQFRTKGNGHKGVLKKERSGALSTRIVDGACIFLNRPGHPGGAGCALHRAALERGVEPRDLKPDVCWQLPLRREDSTAPDGHVTSTLGEWDRRHWGQGGHEFGWWCTEAAEAFSAAEPVYRTLRGEITAITGPKVYALLAAYLERRLADARSAPLPHPAVRLTARR
jgi:hypothetical protein